MIFSTETVYPLSVTQMDSAHGNLGHVGSDDALSRSRADERVLAALAQRIRARNRLGQGAIRALTQVDTMLETGLFHSLRILEHTANGYVLDADGERLLLPTAEAPAAVEVGQNLRVFVYTDSEDRPVATVREPLVSVGKISALQVIDQNHFGAFLNWGLAKDLFLPRDEQYRPVAVGQRVVVALKHDKQGRVLATTFINSALSQEPSGLSSGDHVELLVYGRNDVGFQVVVAGRFPGLIPNEQVHRPLHVAQSLHGWVARVREDHRLDIKLQRVGHAAALDAHQAILDAIDRAGGLLKLHDRSAPEAIQRELHMSKKVFKQAVGSLYKSKLITLSEEGLRRA